MKVEVMEAVMFTMAVMMAMVLGQIDLEVTSVTVFQECLTTDTGTVALLSRAQLGVVCTSGVYLTELLRMTFITFLATEPWESTY